jgi:hypothetical protein
MLEHLSDAINQTVTLMREEKLTLFGARSCNAGFGLMTATGARKGLGSIAPGNVVAEMLRIRLLEEIYQLPPVHTSMNAGYRLSKFAESLPTVRTEASGGV